MTDFELEVGKLMAQFSALENQIVELKKGLNNSNRQVNRLHNDFLKFSNTIIQKMEANFITRNEIAPIKTVVSIGLAAAFSSICLTLSEIFFKNII